MSTITTPNMGLVLPVPTSELGPAWAVEINNALGANALISGVDGHDHSSGKGVLITPSGLSITADLPMNQNNLTLIRSSRYYSNLSPLSAVSPDLECVYVSGVDLYYNDGSGNQIRITQSGSVAGASGTITGLPSGTASAAYQSSPGTFQFLQATSTAANIDAGTLIVRYPGSYPTPSGNYIAIEAPSSLSSGYSLTLPVLPAQTNVMTLATDGTMSSITYDAVGSDMSATGANAVANTRTRTTGTSVAVGGVALSASCGTFTSTSNTFVDVTNLSVTITTSGRPVFLGLVSDGSTYPNVCQVDSFPSQPGNIAILRGSTSIAQQRTGTNQSEASSSYSHVDFPAAGTYTYKVQAMQEGGSTIAVYNSKLVAYEL